SCSSACFSTCFFSSVGSLCMGGLDGPMAGARPQHARSGRPVEIQFRDNGKATRALSHPSRWCVSGSTSMERPERPMPSATFTPILATDFIAAQAGDREAFARLVRATQKTVSSIALAVTRDVQLSEDIAQDTYVKAWQRLGTMHQADSFLPWLREVSRNAA